MSGDETSNQLWIEKERLILLRMIKQENGQKEEGILKTRIRTGKRLDGNQNCILPRRQVIPIGILQRRQSQCANYGRAFRPDPVRKSQPLERCSAGDSAPRNICGSR